MPDLHPHLQQLSLSHVSGRLLRQQLTKATGFKISYSIPSLSKLTSLYIRGIKYIESLLEEGMHSLTSFESLEIHDFPRLVCLIASVECLKDFTSLRSLNIENCERLVSLRLEIQHFTAILRYSLFDIAKSSI